MQWLNNIKGWFSFLGNLINQFNLAFKKCWEWTSSHLFVLLIPILAGIKSGWDFCATLGERIEEQLDKVNLSNFSQGEFSATALDIFEFVNTIFPIQELFIWCSVFAILWGVFLMIRVFKNIVAMLF